MATSSIRFSASAERNQQFILDMLKKHLPGSGTVLEIASGTGQHATYFAAAVPHLTWLPSDPDPEARTSITERIAAAESRNLADPLELDVLAPWPELSIDAIITANLLHISLPAVLPALMKNAGALLKPGDLLHIYGPFKVEGAFTSASNADFDASLRGRNPDWGIRDLETVVAAARKEGFGKPDIRDMPANNFSLAFHRH